MTLALRSPGAVGALIPVDNAPVDANLTGDFAKYLQGMRDIDKANVRKQADADDILKLYVEVGGKSHSPALAADIPFLNKMCTGLTNTSISFDESRPISRESVSPPTHPAEDTRDKP